MPVHKLLCLTGPPTMYIHLVVNSKALERRKPRGRSEQSGLARHCFRSCCASPSAINWVQKVQCLMMFVNDLVPTKEVFSPLQRPAQLARQGRSWPTLRRLPRMWCPLLWSPNIIKLILVFICACIFLWIWILSEIASANVMFSVVENIYKPFLIIVTGTMGGARVKIFCQV